MAYGFNDDKSKWEFEDVFNVISGTVYNVPGKSMAYATVAPGSQYDDMRNYVVVGTMYSADNGATWHTGQDTTVALDTFPANVVATFTDPSATTAKMRVQVVNNTTEITDIQFRIAIMKLPWLVR